MNQLEAYFRNNNDRLIHKWMHYFDIYERHLSRFRGTDVSIVEFGVSQGGSMQMWKDYFGPDCTIYGIDINPHCKELEEGQVKIIIGDQEDREFLNTLPSIIPRIDILIDDGGHTMRQQINTFEVLFPYVSDSGVYLCEDCHTSYSDSFHGGYKRKGAFVEYSKNFIDYINAWHSETDKLKVSDFTRSVDSAHYYDSVVVLEKKIRQRPVNEQTGKAVIPGYNAPNSGAERVKKSLYRLFRPLRRLLY